MDRAVLEHDPEKLALGLYRLSEKIMLHQKIRAPIDSI
jgi:hypothetical protein